MILTEYLGFQLIILPPELSNEEISEFFRVIRLPQVDFSYGELYKYNLTHHWNLFFSTLFNVFSPRKRVGADGITEPIHKIGYVGELTLEGILISMIIT